MTQIFFPLILTLSLIWYDAPYIVVTPSSANVVIMAPDGSIITDRAYWTGSGWEAKIRPTMTGTYTYDGFSAYVPSVPTRPEFSHGAGSPENLLSCQNFPNTPNAIYEDCYQFIEEANELGFTSFYAMTMNIGGDGQDVSPYLNVVDWGGSDENDNLTFDNSKMNSWQSFFEAADRAGIRMWLVLGEGEEANKRELDNGTLGPERKAYYYEMITRFEHISPIWLVSEEYDGDWHLQPDEVISWACYLKKWGAGTVAIHNASQNIPAVFTPFIGNDCIDALAVQSWAYEEPAPLMAWFGNATDKDIYFTEPLDIDVVSWERHCELTAQAEASGASGYFMYSGNWDNSLGSFYWLVDEACP